MDAAERRSELERIHAEWTAAMRQAWASALGSPEGIEARRMAHHWLDEYMRVLLEHYREAPPEPQGDAPRRKRRR